jgi:tRNA(Ile)-lysidine synthase
MIRSTFAPEAPARIGVAVSGGGDSMAMLHLMQSVFDRSAVSLHAVTVDHGLRAEASPEAAMVAQRCAELKIAHDTLVWKDWDGKGNLQAEARNARYDLMRGWAQRHDIDTIAVGHTADDQAETVLMGLARRAGVDGLAGMIPKITRDSLNIVRPLLGATRVELRGYLSAIGVAWAEDPSNQDVKYERIRARKALQALAPLGIDAIALSDVADHMRYARRALNWQTYLAARDLVQIDAGAIKITEKGLLIIPKEIRRRLFIAALKWVSNSMEGPRRSAMADLLDLLDKPSTLHGCQIEKHGAEIIISREPGALRDTTAQAQQLWDNRWRMAPEKPVDVDIEREVRSLGQAGLSQCPEWRETGRTATVLRATPALWKGQTLLAAPLAGVYGGWKAEIEGGDDSFFAALLAQ